MQPSRHDVLIAAAENCAHLRETMFTAGLARWQVFAYASCNGIRGKIDRAVDGVQDASLPRYSPAYMPCNVAMVGNGQRC